MAYNRFLPLLIPFIIWILLEVFFFWPQMVYVILVLAVLLVFFTIRQFTKNDLNQEKWWNFFILPACFLSGLIAFSTMIPNRILIQLLFILNTVFLYFYFCSIYHYLALPTRDQSHSIENLSAYGSFLAVYFISSAIYGLQVFLNIPVWVLTVVMLIALGPIIYQVIWVNKINIRVGFFYILLACLILAELAWSASFLPLSFYVLGLILSICYYMLIGLVKLHLLDKLNRGIIKFYLIFGFSSILAVLFTARWM